MNFATALSAEPQRDDCTISRILIDCLRFNVSLDSETA